MLKVFYLPCKITNLLLNCTYIFDLSQCQRNQSANSDRQMFNAHSESSLEKAHVYCLLVNVSREPDIFFQSSAVEPARRGTATGRV